MSASMLVKRSLAWAVLVVSAWASSLTAAGRSRSSVDSRIPLSSSAQSGWSLRSWIRSWIVLIVVMSISTLSLSMDCTQSAVMWLLFRNLRNSLFCR